MNLKDQGVYRLPNGRELVARLIAEHQTVLYNLSAADPAAYELNPDVGFIQWTLNCVGDQRSTGYRASRALEVSNHLLVVVSQNGI